MIPNDSFLNDPELKEKIKKDQQEKGGKAFQGMVKKIEAENTGGAIAYRMKKYGK